MNVEKHRNAIDYKAVLIDYIFEKESYGYADPMQYVPKQYGGDGYDTNRFDRFIINGTRIVKMLEQLGLDEMEINDQLETRQTEIEDKVEQIVKMQKQVEKLKTDINSICSE